jgi:hypothetical protein
VITAERSLSIEVMMRLRAFPVIVIPIPNGIYMPARTAPEKALVARIINRFKADGFMIPGAPDLVVLSAGGAVLIELKRPAERTLYRRQAQGRLSVEQEEFRDRCGRVGVPYAVCTSWDECRTALAEKGVI